MFRFKSYAVVAVIVLASANRGSAQPAPGVPAPSRPIFSPYLNLLRTDASPTFNYYGLVRPQLKAQSSIQMLQQQVGSIQQQQQSFTQSAVNPTLPVTGQPTYFLNTSGYFLNSRSGIGPTTQQSFTTRRPSQPPAAPSRR